MNQNLKRLRKRSVFKILIKLTVQIIPFMRIDFFPVRALFTFNVNAEEPELIVLHSDMRIDAVRQINFLQSSSTVKRASDKTSGRDRYDQQSVTLRRDCLETDFNHIGIRIIGITMPAKIRFRNKLSVSTCLEKPSDLSVYLHFTSQKSVRNKKLVGSEGQTVRRNTLFVKQLEHSFKNLEILRRRAADCPASHLLKLRQHNGVPIRAFLE